MRKILALLLCAGLITIGGCLLWKGLSGGDKPMSNNSVPSNPALMKPSEVFEENTFIEVADVQISYNGDFFFVCNNRSDLIRVSCSVVGVKNNGAYETLQTVGFYGKDMAQYDSDFQENGWAIEKNTNLVRPSETLQAVLDTSTYVSFGEVSPQIDADNDGFLDVVFTISPQVDEKQITTSTDDPKSDVYKIKIR